MVMIAMMVKTMFDEKYVCMMVMMMIVWVIMMIMREGWVSLPELCSTALAQVTKPRVRLDISCVPANFSMLFYAYNFFFCKKEIRGLGYSPPVCKEKFRGPENYENKRYCVFHHICGQVQCKYCFGKFQ